MLLLLLLLFRIQGDQTSPGLSSWVVVTPFLESGNSRGGRWGESGQGLRGEGVMSWGAWGASASGSVQVQLGVRVWSWTGASAGDRDVKSSAYEGMRSREWDSKEKKTKAGRGGPHVYGAGRGRSCETPLSAREWVLRTIQFSPSTLGCFAFFQFSQKSLIWPLLQLGLILTREMLSGLDAIVGNS